MEIQSPTPGNIEMIKRLFIESQIRGRHQTGLCYLRDNQIKRFVVEGDGEKLVSEFDWDQLLGLSPLVLIGHNRYSTSDLRYPQPIQVFGDFALAHNGVVDQRPSECWDQYGYDLTTANDSELLYHARYEGYEPLEEFPDATMAVVELSVSDGLRWYRNAGRPLYYVRYPTSRWVCSTRDIALRGGLKKPRRCHPGVIYNSQGKSRLLTIPELIS